MTYNWYDTRASTWYEGYGEGAGGTHSNKGNFVNVNTLTGSDKANAIAAIEDNIIGLLEDKGLTAKQAKSSKIFAEAMDKVHEEGDTKGAFQFTASSVSSARDRDDLYGASLEEGGEQGFGASFLADVASGAATGTVTDLYEKGFLRSDEDMAQDTAGLKFWEDKLGTTDETGKTWGIAEIAEAFVASDEAQIRNVYHEQYGREADYEGLSYWRDTNKADPGSTKAESFERIINYQGEDLNNDGKISVQEKLNAAAGDDPWHVSTETLIRDRFRNALGQVSRESERGTQFGGTAAAGASPFFTAAEHGDVMDYVNKIHEGYKVSDDAGAALAWAGVTDINMRMTGRDAISQGDQDDYFAAYDANGDGVIDSRDAAAGGITHDPTYMSRFATKATINELMKDFKETGGEFSIDTTGTFASGKTWDLPENVDEWTAEQREAGHPGMQDFLEFGFKKVMGDKWDALTHERPKTLEDLVGILPHGELIPEHAARLLATENLPDWLEKSGKLKHDWGARIGNNKGNTGTGQDGWTIDPQKPDLPTPLDVDRKNINYMPNLTSDVQDTSGYGQAKTQFDQAVTAAAPDIRTAQGQAGQRLTDTSAQGVRMKRSKAARLGTIRGTKQLGRTEQLKSLNL